MTKTVVISAFPGIGKTYYQQHSDLKVLDSDSSGYSWAIIDGVKSRNPDFPMNYVEHIKENIGKVDVILVSSHKEVRKALVKANIPYVIVYPASSLKNEYLNRYKKRGNDEGFIDMMKKNYSSFISEIEKENGYSKVRLHDDEAYLTDIIDTIFAKETEATKPYSLAILA